MSLEDFILCRIVSTLTEVLRDVYLMTGMFEDTRTGSDSTLSTVKPRPCRERTSSNTKVIDQKHCPSTGTAFIKDRQTTYETDSDVENRLVVAKGERQAGEGWIGSLSLADANYYVQRMNKQQGPTVHTGNPIQYPMINHN